MKVRWNSLEATAEGNFFDGSRNGGKGEIHLAYCPGKVPNGVFFEEIQHALDYHAGVLEVPEASLYGSPEWDVQNFRAHVGTFRRMAENPWFKLSDEEASALRAQADLFSQGRAS